MTPARHSVVDRPFLGIVLVLLLFGFFISSSASLSTISSRESSIPFDPSQLVAALCGLVVMMILARLDYRILRRYALPLFVGSLLLTLAVFLPKIGFSYNGARRWITLGIFSLQPSEFLKLGFIIYFASWLTASRSRLGSLKLGFLPYLLMIGVLAIIMLLQPDTGTFLIMFGVSIAMFIAGGGKWSHLFILFCIGLLGIGYLALTREYVRDRLVTFVTPTHDTLGSSYQINQSLIAIGSGKLFGRGYGQSIQKFNYLPESIGDSVFAVLGEEMGFVGTTALTIGFTIFALWGLKISSRTRDSFGRLLVLGITMMVTIGAFMNIGAMLAIIPLTGVPLPFVSHGGTALVMTLAACGIILSVSRSNSKV